MWGLENDVASRQEKFFMPVRAFALPPLPALRFLADEPLWDYPVGSDARKLDMCYIVTIGRDGRVKDVTG